MEESAPFSRLKSLGKWLSLASSSLVFLGPYYLASQEWLTDAQVGHRVYRSNHSANNQSKTLLELDLIEVRNPGPASFDRSVLSFRINNCSLTKNRQGELVPDGVNVDILRGEADKEFEDEGDGAAVVCRIYPASKQTGHLHACKEIVLVVSAPVNGSTHSSRVDNVLLSVPGREIHPREGLSTGYGSSAFWMAVLLVLSLAVAGVQAALAYVLFGIKTKYSIVDDLSSETAVLDTPTPESSADDIEAAANKPLSGPVTQPARQVEASAATPKSPTQVASKTPKSQPKPRGRGNSR